MSISSLDTSLVVRVLTNDNPEKRQQVLALLSEDRHIFHFFLPALIETVYVLEKVYDFPRDKIIDRLNFFLTHFSDTIIYDRPLTMVAFPLYLEHPQLSFNDCLLSAHAEISHAEPLLTFDQALAKKSPSAKLLA